MISANAMFTGVLGCFCTGMALRQPGYSTPTGLKSGEPLNEVIIFTHFDACHTYELEIMPSAFQLHQFYVRMSICI